ncbi:MAG: hypothetical protein ACYDH9_04750 [Limisphaerales bacterium]
MLTPITVRVVARSDRGVFIAVDDDDEYCVFSLADSSEIGIGDRLLGDFHGHTASTFDASNLTRRNTPRIDLDDWESPLDGALGRLLKSGAPEYAYAGSKRIATNSDDVVLQLREEILRS